MSVALVRARPLARVAVRRFTAAAENPYQAERQAIREHAAHATDLWRKISFYICIPATIICTAWVLKVEEEHSSHVQHIREENGGRLPETPEYEYMNKRARPFPWGYNSLFFNPRTNKDMTHLGSE